MKQPDDSKAKCLASKFSNIIINNVKENSVRLSWSKPEDTGNCDILGYIVVMKEKDQDKFKKVMKVGSNEFSCEVQKVKKGHEYSFRVYAENQVGISKEFASNVGQIRIPESIEIDEKNKTFESYASKETIEFEDNLPLHELDTDKVIH